MKITAIFIDPKDRRIEEVSIEPTLEAVYKLTNATFVEHLGLDRRDTIMFNEIPGPGEFILASGHRIKGPAVIIGAGSEFKNTTLTVDKVRKGVTFLG